MLSEFSRKLYESKQPGHTRGDSPVTPPHGTLSDFQIVPEPFYGEVNGTPVTIIGIGNMQGFSPVSWCVEQGGENAWLPTETVKITDPRLAPLTR